MEKVTPSLVKHALTTAQSIFRDEDGSLFVSEYMHHRVPETPIRQVADIDELEAFYAEDEDFTVIASKVHEMESHLFS